MPTTTASRERDCRKCGARFTYEVRKGKAPDYCSDDCRREATRTYYAEWKQRRTPRQLETACLTCGAPITRALRDQGQPRKFCDSECRSRYRCVSAHGLGNGRYAELLAEQGGGCALCGTDEPGGSHGRSFHIDHCHDSGAVRGLLCSPCNQALGLFKDNPEVLRAAAEYIERSH